MNRRVQALTPGATTISGALAGLLLLTGCSSFKTEMGRPLPAPGAELAEGRTRVEAVVRELGPPHQATALADGFAFLYEYSRIGEFQFGFSVNVAVLRYLKFVKAWNRLDQQALLLTFDRQGVLQSVGSSQSGENLGGGSAVQLVVAAVSLTDVAAIRRPADAHSWGRWLLQPLPVTLNSESNLRTGQNGLQQRTAPKYAGQQTLEMTKPKRVKKGNRPPST